MYSYIEHKGLFLHQFNHSVVHQNQPKENKSNEINKWTSPNPPKRTPSQTTQNKQTQNICVNYILLPKMENETKQFEYVCYESIYIRLTCVNYHINKADGE